MWVNRHANSGLFSGDCTDLNVTYSVAHNWTIDRSKADTGHPGIAETAVQDNQQSKNTLRGYNYAPTSDSSIVVTGRICGAAAAGPGAIFARLYRICLIG